jgi:hypothetical protein
MIDPGFALNYGAGIARRKDPDDTLKAMLKRADATLYLAKAEGPARTLAALGPGRMEEHPALVSAFG